MLALFHRYFLLLGQRLQRFSQQESAPSVVLLACTALALLLANTSWGVGRYFPLIWEQPVRLAGHDIHLLHWINEGLMAVFFLVAGLELKKELLLGHLASVRQAALPIAAALGGMVVPALLFLGLNWHLPTARGWSIPLATDIAFALAVLRLVTRRVPAGLKAFLLALAIVDDFGAILLIAFFYTSQLHWPYLIGALVLGGILAGLNARRVTALGGYLLVGALLWYCVLQSGIHATLAGVLTAAAIPVTSATTRPAPAERLAQALHPLVNFGILPLFAFANTSIVLSLSVVTQLTSPLGVG